jgi:hypothetical protein
MQAVTGQAHYISELGDSFAFFLDPHLRRIYDEPGIQLLDRMHIGFLPHKRGAKT